MIVKPESVIRWHREGYRAKGSRIGLVLDSTSGGSTSDRLVYAPFNDTELALLRARLIALGAVDFSTGQKCIPDIEAGRTNCIYTIIYTVSVRTGL